MKIICDLHLHSRYSMATSPKLNLRSLSEAANRTGINLLAAPDFTHPTWQSEMYAEVKETQPGSGIYSAYETNFILVTEVSCIWRQNGKGRRVHLLVTAPNFDATDKLSKTLSKFQNLYSDGRLTLTISARELFAIARDADARCEIIPAHVFTPWYGIFGTKSGFDSIEECFGDLSNQIYAVETGLSSDPEMHWSFPDSACRSIVSFSDAHSSPSVGRELTTLDVKEMSYTGIIDALRERKVVSTYEFHPEHGKYHLDGHRKCNVRMSPDESDAVNGICPVCGRGMTLGVMNRASELSSLAPRRAMMFPDGELHDPKGHQPPFRRVIPLREIVSYALNVGVNTKKVEQVCNLMINKCKNELNVLLECTHEEILSACGEMRVADAVISARIGDVDVKAGYDGVYGSATPRLKSDNDRSDMDKLLL